MQNSMELRSSTELLLFLIIVIHLSGYIPFGNSCILDWDVQDHEINMLPEKVFHSDIIVYANLSSLFVNDTIFDNYKNSYKKVTLDECPGKPPTLSTTHFKAALTVFCSLKGSNQAWNIDVTDDEG